MLELRQLQNVVGTAFPRRPRRTAERQSYRGCVLVSLFSLLFSLSCVLTPRTSLAEVPPVTHTLSPFGVSRVCNTPNPEDDSWASANVNFYPCAVAGTHTVAGAAYAGTNGCGQVRGGVAALENRGECGDFFTKTATIDSSTPANTVLKDDTVYTVAETVTTTGLAVEEGAIAVIYIPKGVTLTTDSPASGRAGLRVPKNSTLVLCGDGAFDGRLVDTASGREEMGLVLVLGTLGGAAEFGAAGLLYTSRDVAAPEMDFGSRTADRTVSTYWPIRYDVTFRDDDGTELGSGAATLGLPYTGKIAIPQPHPEMTFAGYTNSLGALVINSSGKPTENVCTTIGDHELYAVWASRYQTIDSSTKAGTLLKDGATYVVTESVSLLDETSDDAVSGLVVEEGATAVLYIPKGITLTVQGTDFRNHDPTPGFYYLRACAGIHLPTNSTLIVCGEGSLIARGGGTDGYGAPAGIGCGASTYKWYLGPIFEFVAYYGGAAAGIGGDGQVVESVAPYSSMGTLYVIGGLSVTAQSGAHRKEIKSTGDSGTFFTSETLAPTLDVSGGRAPDGHADTHDAIRYGVLLRDADGSIYDQTEVTLAMPYPERVDLPKRQRDMAFAGYTNTVGDLIYDEFGRSTGIPCRTVGSHSLYAKWTPLGPSEKYGIIDDQTSAGTLLRNGTTYTVTNSPTIIGGVNQNALVVDEDSTVVIYIPKGETLTVEGGSVASGGTGRACAGIRLPSGSTLIICGEGELVATGGAALNAGSAAPYGIGSGGSRTGHVVAGSGTGSAAGIGGDGETDSVLGHSRAEMGTLYLFGRLVVTAMPGEASLSPEAAADNGLLITSATPTATPTLLIGGDREPDDSAETHVAIQYEAVARDLEGGVVATVKATLAMPYPYVSPPPQSGERVFVGYTNTLGRLVIGPRGNPTPNVCTMPYEHEIYAVWLGGVNTTEDQAPEAISYEDDTVSLREAFELIAVASEHIPASTPIPVPISPKLKGSSSEELVFHVSDIPLSVTSQMKNPTLVDGRAAGNRPFVIEGGANRWTPLFQADEGRSLRLQNITVRNTSGTADGVAVRTAIGSELVISNVLFEAIAVNTTPGEQPGHGVRAFGSSRLLQTTFRNCTGKPFSIGETTNLCLIAESTVVPREDGRTMPPVVGSYGAMLSCTVPCGVAGPGQIVGSYTNAITDEIFCPATALSTNVSNVSQSYYRPYLISGLANKGEGCFLWHDAAWTNVAWSVMRTETLNPILGDPARATELYNRDVRGTLIAFPWNTRGSYAMAIRLDAMAANTTDDQEPSQMLIDDDVVSLREAILLASVLAPAQEKHRAHCVQIDPSLSEGTGELVFALGNSAVRVMARQSAPVTLDGAAAGDRPLVIDGGGERTAPLFQIEEGRGLSLRGVTLRNASGSSAGGGLAVNVDSNGWFCAENCRFTDFVPGAAEVSCVRALGSGAIVRSTWTDCPGRPFDIGSDGESFTLAESTVVPCGDVTVPGEVRSGGAVLACTIPSGVNATGTGVVLGSYTEPIADEKFYPTTAMTVTVDRVDQCCYRPNLTGGLAKKGEGCFVWHDPHWANVAWSVTADEDAKTEVFGWAPEATNRIDRDVRNVPINFPWNTRGSVAIAVGANSYTVNTTDDEVPTTITTEDGVVTLREAIELQNLLSPEPSFGQPDRITFKGSMIREPGDLVFALLDHPIPVTALASCPLVLDGAAAGNRPLVIDGGDDPRTTPLFEVAGDAAFRLSGVTLRNAAGTSARGGQAIDAGANSLMIVSNCLFAALSPASDVACVRTSGAGAILQSSWTNCTGRPLVTEGAGPFTLAESTVVPTTGTQAISLGAGGAVLASTVPSGVEGDGKVVGSHTEAITARQFVLTEPQSVTVGKVTQLYYRVGLCGGLARKGEGCFVWHDDIWTNVAWSVLTNDAKTAVHGSVDAATELVGADVRNVPIGLPWNTRGSYAFAVKDATFEVNMTNDEAPELIDTEDDRVSLREAIELQCLLSPDPSFGAPERVTFSDALTAGSDDLVFKLLDRPISVTAFVTNPLRLDGAATGDRPLEIDGDGARTTPVFDVMDDSAFHLANVTVRNAAGTTELGGQAIYAGADSRLFVSNCLFAALTPASGVACVETSGAGAILQSSWKDCAGRPLVTEGADPFTLAESTVVPTTGTQEISLGTGGAVLASTVPCGVTGSGRTFGSITSAITSGMCYPTTPLAVTVGKVTQYYYRAGLCSGLANKGEGFFVWHDAEWTNVARSVLTGDQKTAVHGSADKATQLVDADVRGEKISFPWNTRGSYAIGSREGSDTVTTTADQNPWEVVTDDATVSLREALELLSILSPEGTTERRNVTFSSDLAKGTGDLVFTLKNYPITVYGAKEALIRLDGASAPERMVAVDGGGARTNEMFAVRNGCGFCLANVVVRNASGGPADGKALAISAAEGSLLFVSNCLFTSLAPASGAPCVTALGNGAIAQASWTNCTGSAANIGAEGGTFTLLESTVVPTTAGDTLPVTVNTGGAVISCTIPTGVTKSGSGQVIASHTTAITDEFFRPTDVQTTNQSHVTQYYYSVVRGSGYCLPGEGQFVWHDPHWQNIAVSARRTDDKTSVFGDTNKATILYNYDVRGRSIIFPYNTRGSYAVGVGGHYPLDVNTTEDPPLSEFDSEDETVSLREAIDNLKVLFGIRRSEDSLPNEITFDDSLFEDGVATFRLPQGPLVVPASQLTADQPLRMVAPADGRRILLDGEGQRNILTISPTSHVFLTGIDFVNGYAKEGGAIWAGGPLTAERCRFRSNKATVAGGAIYKSPDAALLTLRDSVFESNGCSESSESKGGGAVYAFKGQVDVTRCTFTSNKTPGGDGAAVHIDDEESHTSVGTLVDSVFTGNSGKNTGAVCARGTLTVEGCEFRENSNADSGWGGSAVYIQWGTSNTVRRSVFVGNQSAGSGALHANNKDSRLVVERCLFKENASAASGGGVYAAGELSVAGSTFRGNTAGDTVNEKGGGGVSCRGTKLKVAGCRFEGNSAAKSGGGLCMNYSASFSALVTDSTFVGNTATGWFGGGLCFELDKEGAVGQVTLVNCSLFDNTAGDAGGGLFVRHGDVMVVNSTVTGNEAPSYGGGVYTGNNGPQGHCFVNALVTGNRSPKGTSTADVFTQMSSIKVYDSMIRYGGSIAKDTANNWVFVGNSAAEGNIFASGGEKYSEIANGASQLGRRLKDPGDAPNPSCGAVVKHNSDWSNVSCTPYRLDRYTGQRIASAPVTLRSGAGSDELRSDITGRTFASDVTPCMGSLWRAADSASGVVTTLADVSDSFDGAVSLREILSKLNTSADWRTKLYDTALGGYRITFKDGMAGSLKLKGSTFVLEGLGGTPVYVIGPTDRPITIDGQGQFRGFNVAAGESLFVSDLTFTNCCCALKDRFDYDGGAIRNAGSLVATNVAFYTCSAGPTNSAPAGWGGAVATLAGADSRLERCTFAGNVAVRGGAVAVRDGGRLTVAGATFAGNGVRGSGSVTEALGNAAYVEGAATDVLFAQCTFANNAGANHTATEGGAAVYVDNSSADTAKTVLANCVAVANGGADLATKGKLRLVGTTYGVKTALGGATDTDATWYFNAKEAATCTNAVATADVYAHTLTNGTPVASERRSGAVDHVVLPLAHLKDPLGSVYLRASANWATVGWSATAGATPILLRGTSSIVVKRAPLVTTDQLGASTLGAASWAGAVIAREVKSREDPPPVGPEPGAITEPTYEGLLNAIATAQSRSPDDLVVFVTEATSNATIKMTSALNFSGSCRVTIRGPLTLDARGAERIFSVAGGVTLRLEAITLTGGDATKYSIEEDGGCGGAVYLFNEDTSKLAALEAVKCTFTNNAAYYGGAVAALGLGCAESFVDCVFPAGSNAVKYDSSWDYGGEGAAIYHDDRNLKISGGTIDLSEIWPRPAYAVTTASGAAALFGAADVPDPSASSVGAAALDELFEDAQDYAATAGAGAKIIPLSTAAIAAKAAATGVPAAALAAEMTPEVTEITISAAAGGEDGEVSIAPQNVVPFMTYSIEYAASPEALGTPAAQSGNKVQADASGRLAEPLKAPAKGTSGFYRVVAE